MTRIAVILCAASMLLAACGQTADAVPEIRTVEVAVPVAVSCVPASANTNPKFEVNAVDVRTAPSPEERYRRAAAGFLERDAWVLEAVAVLRGCRD